MRGKRILILGGTRDAREAADLLLAAGAVPTTSLAGATREPAPLAGIVRIGGFGGVEGLRAYLAGQAFAAIVDATHPFAARMSAHAAEAARQCGLPIVRLERPSWRAGAGDRWLPFASCEAAATALVDGERLLLTVGRKELAPFFSRPGVTGVARMIEAPAIPVPSGWTIICARPPFLLADEVALMERHAITLLVAKNSGGADTRAKLDAARERGIPVFLIERPLKPRVAAVADPQAILPLLASLLWA